MNIQYQYNFHIKRQTCGASIRPKNWEIQCLCGYKQFLLKTDQIQIEGRMQILWVTWPSPRQSIYKRNAGKENAKNYKCKWTVATWSQGSAADRPLRLPRSPGCGWSRWSRPGVSGWGTWGRGSGTLAGRRPRKPDEPDPSPGQQRCRPGDTPYLDPTHRLQKWYWRILVLKCR